MFVNFFVAKYQKWINKRFDQVPRKTMSALQRYHFPGNIRELENMIEKAVILSPEGRLQIDLPAQAHGRSAKKKTLEALEREYILEVLQGTGWTIKGPGGAARELGLKPSTLWSRMRKLGITRPSPLEPSSRDMGSGPRGGTISRPFPKP